MQSRNFDCPEMMGPFVEFHEIVDDAMFEGLTNTNCVTMECLRMYDYPKQDPFFVYRACNFTPSVISLLATAEMKKNPVFLMACLCRQPNVVNHMDYDDWETMRDISLRSLHTFCKLPW